MNEIELTIWTDFGGGDGDNCEESVTINDKDYKSLIALIQEYKQSSESCCGQEFTKEWLYNKNEQLFSKLLRMAAWFITESLKRNGYEKDEIESVDYGFYISDEFIEKV